MKSNFKTDYPLKFVMVSTFYPPYHLGGDAMHVYYLSNELARLGHEVHVIYSIDAYYLNKTSPPSGAFANNKGVFLHPLKSNFGRLAPLVCGFLGTSYPLANQALGLIEKIKPDVIHYHNIAGFGPSILKALASKNLYTAHDYWLICPRNNLLTPNKTICIDRQNCFSCCLQLKRPPQMWRYTGILDKMLQNIDVIIAPSDYMRNTLVGAGISRPVITIPNFVPKPASLVKSAYDFPYFLFVGLLEEHKGILGLVKTFCQIKDRITANLLIVGSGSLEFKIQELIIKSNCQNRIKILGKVNNYDTLTNLYSNAVALIIPSIGSENAPLVALEALACGTPIITSDLGGLPEISSLIDNSLVFHTKKDLENILTNFKKDDYDPNLLYSIFKLKYSSINYISKYKTLINH